MAVDRHAPFLNDLTRRTRSSEAFSRIASLQGDDALAFLDEEQREIDVFRQHSSCYGCVFYLLKKEG